MSVHDVKFTVPQRPLGKADVQFAIRRDDELLGRLKVSNGTLVWVPRNKTYGFRLAWAKFDDLMRKHGESEK